MQQTVTIHEERRTLATEVTWASTPLKEDIAALRAGNKRLRRVTKAHVVVDHACGIVTILAPCRRSAARGLLVGVSRQCDLKIREVAASLVAAAEGEPLPEQIQRPLRRVLRRPYAADQ